MSPVTVVWSMIAAACLTLAAVHFPVWWRNRDARASLAFSIAAICTAALALCELTMLKAPTPAVYATALRWANVPVALLMVALAAFAYHYLDAGLRWLAGTAIALRLVSLVIDFTVGDSLNFIEITSLRAARFLGEQVATPVGVRNPWQAIGQLAVVLLLLFFVAASVRAWRQRRRAAAVLVGGSLVFFMVASLVQVYVIYWQDGNVPSTVTLFAIGVVAVMGYALSADLLRAKRLVGELSEREREVDLAADAANLGIWTRDIVTDRLVASRKLRELFGLTADEHLDAEQLVERVHPDDRAAFRDRLSQAARRRGEYQMEFRLVLPDGQLRWIAAQGRVDFDARNTPVRSCGVCIDVTEKKLAEQEMLRLRQDIAHVGRVSVMGQISSALAHEINQPLGAILRNAEAAALFMQHESPDLHEISAILEDIRKDDERASEVIDRIRALLRREEVAMTTLNVRSVLGDVATLLRPDAAARHVALALTVPADLPAVRGDQVQVQQVLLNLILNGMDSLEGVAGGPRAVAVTARREGPARVEISVSDSGRGIDPANLARIFEPFFTTKPKGIGMGLSISRGIIEAHGGRLWAENNPGAGATFRFTLPVAA
ncbi:MAG TPA: ATP-binding protein [Caldimonas sp.]|nr:ATP-binding protein [Caldimonas sp.]